MRTEAVDEQIGASSARRLGTAHGVSTLENEASLAERTFQEPMGRLGSLVASGGIHRFKFTENELIRYDQNDGGLGWGLG